MENPKVRTGIVVKLEAKTKKGKDRIAQQGSRWLIEAIAEKVLFDDKNGIWLGLRGKLKPGDTFRWVHLTDDENFKVVIE